MPKKPHEAANGQSGVVVIGAGLMGLGIAQLFAQAGHRVQLLDNDPSCRDTARERLRQGLAFLTEHGLLSYEQALAAESRVTIGAGLEAALAGSPLLVLEAICEDLGRKRALFRTCDRLTPPSTILASNSSGLSITAMAAGLKSPERLCGAHFWNPPQLIPLVEVVYGEATAEATGERMSTLLREAGKTPVAVRKDIPGFVGNRLLHALQREAMSLVERGVASAADVDLVVTRGFGRRLGVVGPLAVCDLAGLDLVLDVDSYLLADLDRSTQPSPLLRSLVDQGRLGVKTGEGFYRWTEQEIQHTLNGRDRTLVEGLLRDAGVEGADRPSPDPPAGR
jgi:3-hydroxybutyryl-CoA dehydrogenase